MVVSCCCGGCCLLLLILECLCAFDYPDVVFWSHRLYCFSRLAVAASIVGVVSIFEVIVMF